MALPCFGLTRMVNSLFTSLPSKTPHVGVILVIWPTLGLKPFQIMLPKSSREIFIICICYIVIVLLFYSNFQIKNKRIDPKTDPWGTPLKTRASIEWKPFMVTNCFLLVRNCSIHLNKMGKMEKAKTIQLLCFMACLSYSLQESWISEMKGS